MNVCAPIISAKLPIFIQVNLKSLAHALPKHRRRLRGLIYHMEKGNLLLPLQIRHLPFKSDVQQF